MRRWACDGVEERAIRSVLAEKGCPAELMLFEMALESAMRLREIKRSAYRFEEAKCSDSEVPRPRERSTTLKLTSSELTACAPPTVPGLGVYHSHLTKHSPHPPSLFQVIMYADDDDRRGSERSHRALERE